MLPKGSCILQHLELCHEQIQVVMHGNNTSLSENPKHKGCKNKKADDQNKIPFFCYFFHSLLLLSLSQFFFADESITIFKVSPVLLRTVG